MPSADYFKPRGIPMIYLEEVALSVDELEAVRLADMEGQYHEKAARSMGVSRATFGRIVETARRKIAQALVLGKALKIEGGNYDLAIPKSGAKQCPRPGCLSTQKIKEKSHD
jgi:predicted DNA-binding protein (UPF0251 family)